MFVAYDVIRFLYSKRITISSITYITAECITLSACPADIGYYLLIHTAVKNIPMFISLN